MKQGSGILLIGISLLHLCLSCEYDRWDEYYGKKPETINKNLWDAIREDGSLTSFVQLMEDSQLDTIFMNYDTYTLFVPNNSALESYQAGESGLDTVQLLEYHISRHYIQSNYIQGTRKLQTMLEKYALYQREGTATAYDGIEVIYESPLYENGKFYILEQVAEPKENIFQYIARINPVLKNYIESQDSIIIDKELSKPIGFDEFGNIIYDTVAIIYNEFEETYFPVREEFRNSTATLVFPGTEQYKEGLNRVAQELGGEFVDHQDIPVQWQEDVLIPYLLHKGFFLNMVEPHEFQNPFPLQQTYHKLLNIEGDSVIIDYTPVNKRILSNGYAYVYSDFSIPDSLFVGTYTFEAEWLLDETGINKYDWSEGVSVSSSRSFAPLQDFVGQASNDSIISVRFPDDYAGTFNLEFYTDPLFPAEKFLVVVGTHMDIGGIYNVYVNDELVREEFDYYEYVLRRGVLPSVDEGFYKPEERFNKFDFWVENHTGYGRVKIRFEYVGPGDIAKQGLAIDHIDFIPIRP